MRFVKLLVGAPRRVLVKVAKFKSEVWHSGRSRERVESALKRAPFKYSIKSYEIVVVGVVMGGGW